MRRPYCVPPGGLNVCVKMNHRILVGPYLTECARRKSELIQWVGNFRNLCVDYAKSAHVRRAHSTVSRGHRFVRNSSKEWLRFPGRDRGRSRAEGGQHRAEVARSRCPRDRTGLREMEH